MIRAHGVPRCSISLKSVRKHPRRGLVRLRLSALFHGECTVKDGRIEQTNIDNYQLMRISVMPKVGSIIVGLRAASRFRERQQSGPCLDRLESWGLHQSCFKCGAPERAAARRVFMFFEDIAPTPEISRTDRTAWLGREDSNSQMSF
jgi:hypothetical protein